MMLEEKKGIVAAWFGQMNSQKEFDDYLREQYDIDEQPISRFGSDFGFFFYDHDFMEAQFVPVKEETLQLLRRFSYADSFAGELEKTSGASTGWNVIILLYDHAYIGKMQQAQQMHFAGNFAYRASSL